MKILLVSDLNFGGAAVALRRLQIGLTHVPGFQTTWAHCSSPEQNEVDVAGWPPYHVQLLRRILRGSPKIVERLDFYGNSLAVGRFLKRSVPDVINLHNLHDAYQAAILTRLPPDVPLVWTLHDMWPLTGYCCYRVDCGQYDTGCLGNCPQLNLWGRTWESPSKGWRRKQLFYERNVNRIAFVSPSKWLGDCTRARVPKGARVRVIPNGVPHDVFKPIGDKSAVRKALGLPMERCIVLCGSQNIDDPRKGTNYLVNALKGFAARKHEGITVVAFGYKPRMGDTPADWIYTGAIRDEALLNLYYNAADVFVLPSLADNLPNTLIEAISAGTPCVTFDVGGCPEIIRDGETGFVARAKDVAHLAECVLRALDMGAEQRREMSENCRRIAVAEYDVKLQAQRYCALFEEMITP